MTRTKAITETVTIHVPFRIVKRGGRKEMILPAGSVDQRSRVDSTLIKAVGRAFRWKRLLETGEFTTVAELANREGIAVSYLTRVMRLTQLAPDIVEAILDGRQPPSLSLEVLRDQLPLDWPEQRVWLGV